MDSFIAADFNHLLCCGDRFEDERLLNDHIELKHGWRQTEDVHHHQTVTELVEQKDPITAADAGSETIANANNSETTIPDGEAVSNQVNSIASLHAAFAYLAFVLSSENAASRDIASIIAGADQESFKRANFALLASAALELRHLVDLQVDINAKSDYVTSSTNWLKRSLETLIPDESLHSKLVEQRDIVAAAAGAGSETIIETPVSDGVAALNWWLKQQLLKSDGEPVSNQENATTSFHAAFAHLASSVVSGADEESFKRANFALLASASLELKSQVDLQFDNTAKSDYVTSSTNWLKRSLETLITDESLHSKMLVEQDRSIDASLRNEEEHRRKG